MIDEEAILAEIAPSAFETDSDRQSAAWDLAQAPRNYLTLVIAQILGGLASFASVWVVTKYLGATGYGDVVAFIAASQIAMMLAVNWTSFSVSRIGCEEFVKTGKIAATFWMRLLILIPNLLLVMALTPLWLPTLGRVLQLPSNSTWLVVSLLAGSIWWIHIQQALQGVKLIRLQGWLLLFERGLILLAVCVLMLAGELSVVRVGWLYVLGPIGAGLFGLAKLKSLIWPLPQIDRAYLSRILRFSIPIIPTMVVGCLWTNHLDALFITNYLSHAKLGIYSVAYQFTGLTQQLPLLVGTLVLPLMVTLGVSGRTDRTMRFMREVLPALTFMWTVACSLIATVGSWLGPLVFGPQFTEMGLLVWPLMAASALAGPVLIGYVPITNAASTTWMRAVGVTIAALINVVLNFVLIPRFGLLGSGWATMTAYAIDLLILFVIVHRRLVPGFSWVLEAALPIILATTYVSIYGNNAVAGTIAIASSALISLRHRRSIGPVLTSLREYFGLMAVGRATATKQ